MRFSEEVWEDEDMVGVVGASVKSEERSHGSALEV
jgi:hypothetical protein